MFKPLLAATIKDIEKLRYPLAASPKLDGIRALVHDGHLVSRKLRPIDNDSTRMWFSHQDLAGLDGELILGPPTATDCFDKTTSAVRSKGGQPRIIFHVFDDFTKPTMPYMERYRELKLKVADFQGLRIKVLEQVIVHEPEQLERLESHWVDEGHEGMMLRSLDGQYKFGRSTLNEGYLMKLKRFDQDTARIIGFEEEMKNTNEPTISATGKTKRTKHKGGMVGKDTLGALQAVVTSGPFKGVEISVTGISAAMKKTIWQNKEKFMGLCFTFNWFPIGSKFKPRHPTFGDFIL